jgi:thiosulfate reductase cytochrome b subunit
MSQFKIVNKHPLTIRIFHWINFFTLSIMVWSGILIYWANDTYRIGLGNFTLFHFFPEAFFDVLNLGHWLAKGMSFHFTFMWLFILNGVLYVIFLFITGQFSSIFPEKKSFKEALLVVLHDLHIKRGLPSQKKYNAAQRIAYTAVLFMGLFIVITGFAIYKPVQLHWLCSLLGGYEWARGEHFTLAILFCLFFLVHIVQVIFAGWNNFRGMVTGFDVEKLADDEVEKLAGG